MAKCTVCEKEMCFADKVNAKSFDGLCRSCTDHNRKIAAGLEDKTIEEAAFETRELDATIDAILLTTETAPNLNIVSRVGIIMAEVDCVFSVEMVKHNHALQSKLRSEAYSIGANAVVGITFNMIETYSATLGVSKVNTFKLIASGTAVVVEEMNDG